MSRQFRFALGGPCVMTGQELREVARRAEAIGYSALTFPDSFRDLLAPVPAMAMVAECTSRIRVGATVLGNDYRHPAIVAKEAATLDLLSEGRLELGLGAGYIATDYRQAGLRLDPPSTRIARLGESVTIIKTLLREGACDFEGRYYHISGLRNPPLPVQRPHPPIFIGGGGRQILELASREADIVGLAPRFDRPGDWSPRTVSAAATARKIEIIRAAAGSRLPDLEINVYPVFGSVQVTAHRRAAASRLREQISARYPRMDMDEEELLDSPHVFIGTAAQLREKLVAMRERFGVSYIRVGYRSLEDFAPVVEHLAGR
jgi:probable F420-dependent oxidoreductase